MWNNETIYNNRKFAWGRMRPAFIISTHSIQRCTVLREEKVSSWGNVPATVHCSHTHYEVRLFTGKKRVKTMQMYERNQT